MIIHIQTLSHEKFFIDVAPSDTIGRLKEIIFEEEGIYPQHMIIIFAGKQL